MAEKEERQNNDRINAEKYKRRIKKGRIYIDVRDKKLNCLLSKVYTRQEAIEKMAKAMCHSPSGTCEDCFAREIKKACKQAMFGMKELAEAALNALLGEK